MSKFSRTQQRLYSPHLEPIPGVIHASSKLHFTDYCEVYSLLPNNNLKRSQPEPNPLFEADPLDNNALRINEFRNQSGAKNMGLVSCPCCVPISYILRPEETECDWPPTPSPTVAPTTRAEFLASNGVFYPGRFVAGPMVVATLALVVTGLCELFTA